MDSHSREILLLISQNIERWVLGAFNAQKKEFLQLFTDVRDNVFHKY